jgi:hypothetical protein
MDITQLVVAVLLTGIGAAMLRHPTQSRLTQKQEDEATLGKGVELTHEMRSIFIKRGAYGAPLRASAVRALGFLFAILGIVLAMKALAII